MEGGSFKKHSRGRERGQTDNDHFYRSGTVGDWQNHLPIELVRNCCDPIKPLMQQYGYEHARQTRADALRHNARSTPAASAMRP